MLNFTFENQGSNTYLVYELKDKDVVDTMGIGMMTNNNIVGLAPMFYTQLNNQRYLKYNISSKVSLDQILMGTVNKKRILGVFSNIIKVLLATEEYMIDINTVVLDTQYIYADVTTSKVVLISIPIINNSLGSNESLDFFKKIMYGSQFDQNENCSYIASIINYLNSAAVFSLHEFSGLIDSLIGKDSNPTITNNQKQDAPKRIDAASMQTNQGQVNQMQEKQPSQIQQSIPNYSKVPQHQESQQYHQAPQQQVWQNQQVAQVAPQVNMDNPAGEKKKWSLFGTKNSKPKEKPVKVKGANTVKAPKNVKNIPGNPIAPNMALSAQPAPQAYNKISAAPQTVVTSQQPFAPNKTNNMALPVIPTNNQPVKSIPGNFGETTVLGELAASGETTVLGMGAASETIPYLLRLKSNERIKLSKPVFRIGKEKSYVDYFIGDNTAVSRSHANIINHQNEYYVVDTNSTNHTYVNDQMIQSNTEIKLTHGTKLRLANEEFEFKIY